MVHRAEAVTGEVGVDLRGGEISVSEELLNDPQVGTALEQVSRVRVAQRVRMQSTAVVERDRSHDSPHVACPECTAALVEERHAG